MSGDNGASTVAEMTATKLEMTAAQKARLEGAGWTVTDAAGFLGMTPAEAAVMKVRFALRRMLKEARQVGGVSQKTLAAMMGTSQQRIACLESGRESASLDLLIQALLTVGARPAAIGAVIAKEGDLAGHMPALETAADRSSSPSPHMANRPGSIKRGPNRRFKAAMSVRN